MWRLHPSPTSLQATLLQRSWLVAAPVLATRMGPRSAARKPVKGGAQHLREPWAVRHQQRIRLESALRARRS